jgi:BMFP domain-containing protein YqiC
VNGDVVWDFLGKVAIVVTGILGSIIATLWVRIVGLTERVAMLEQVVETLPDAIKSLTAELKESRKDRDVQIERLHDKLDQVRKDLSGDVESVRRELSSDIKNSRTQ